MVIPWQNRAKDLRQELFDVMIQLPVILQQFDKARAIHGNPPGMDTIRFEFFRACKEFDDATQAWVEKLRAQVGPEYLERVSNGIPESFDLKDVVFAQTMALYWTSCAIFYGTVRLAFMHFQVTPPSAGNCSTEDRFDPRPYASNIARSVKYFFQPDAGTVSAQSFSFPMGMALQYFSYANAEATDEYKLLTQGFGQGPNGAMIRGFLLSIQKTSSDRSNAASQTHEDRDEEYEEDLEYDTKYSNVRDKARSWFDRRHVALSSRQSSKSPGCEAGMESTTQESEL
jgi:hypothetical protein